MNAPMNCTKQFFKKNVYFFICLCSFCFLNAQAKVESGKKTFIYEWLKANGDTYSILIENELETPLEFQIIEKTCLQILLRTMLKSKNFEDFTPVKIKLNTDEKMNLARLYYATLNRDGAKEEAIEFFSFDQYGNVFSE